MSARDRTNWRRRIQGFMRVQEERRSRPDSFYSEKNRGKKSKKNFVFSEKKQSGRGLARRTPPSGDGVLTAFFFEI